MNLQQVSSRGSVQSCTCKDCQDMCRRPCWGTPAEILELIGQGYGKDLMLDWWERDSHLPHTEILCPATDDCRGSSAGGFWWMTRIHACVFQTEDKLCSLHTRGLKPTEGKAAIHYTSEEEEDHPNMHLAMAQSWNTPEGKALVTMWREEFYGWDRG